MFIIISVLSRVNLFGYDFLLIIVMVVFVGCGFIYEYFLFYYVGCVLGLVESVIYVMIGIMIVVMGIGVFLVCWFKDVFIVFVWFESIIVLVGMGCILVIVSVIVVSYLLLYIFFEIFNLFLDIVFNGYVFEKL